MSSDFKRPKLVHIKTSVIVGATMLLLGNGGLAYAEKYISSGLAALLVASVSFWLVILGWVWLRSEKPKLKTALGLVIGFFGVWLLIDNGGSSVNATGDNGFWTVIVVLSAFFWAFGSLYGVKAPTPDSALTNAGLQMLAGGAALIIASGLMGEWSQFVLRDVSRNSWLGLVYLIVFGSIVGFTAYSWILQNAKPSAVATYAYVQSTDCSVSGMVDCR